MSADFSRPLPEPGETWLHYEGSLCHVLQVAEHPKSQRPDPRSGRPGPVDAVVVYQCAGAPARTFYRTLPEWMGDAYPGPRPRFVPAPPPKGRVCLFCQGPATQWQGLDPWCGPACDGVPF